MPRPFASRVELSRDVREQLQSLSRARSAPQALVFRSRIILLAASEENLSNQAIAAQLGCDRHTVGQWPERFVQHGLSGLQDLPRPGRPRTFSPSQQAAVVTIATTLTKDHDHPKNGWTLDDLAFEMLKQAHAEQISRSTIQGRLIV